MNKKLFWAVLLVALLTLVTVISVAAVSGAAYTTFNAAADGAGKDVCKNSAINCNIYGAKEYVWLNGGPTANGLGPDGQYFFAVLVARWSAESERRQLEESCQMTMTPIPTVPSRSRMAR